MKVTVVGSRIIFEEQAFDQHTSHIASKAEEAALRDYRSHRISALDTNWMCLT